MKATVTIPLLLGSLAASTHAIGIRFCTDANFHGTCGTYNLPRNTCWNVPRPANDKISSLDTLGANCIFYKDAYCKGPSFKANGKKPTIPANMNDKISSVKCT
ncbi:hypothetical protein EG327_006499 [Venturia inaequalis]|uniref:Secreted protein n=2 Tax=Venturia inaequalis TaxID=5025 RepID=A0A8H3Z5P4_VENIN|nr:hypothetical protein EG327_006499 [Venturia inaequalis]